MNVLFYILAFTGFLIAAFFVSKFNQKMVDNGVEKAKAADMMPVLANKLGLTYTDLSKHLDTKNNIMDTGSKIAGEYKGIPLEIVMHMRANHENVPIGYTSAYSYVSEKFIKFTVSNKDKKSFQIMPKSEGAVSKLTGNKDFDDKELMMIGDIKIPNKYLSEFAKLGWMDLKLHGNTLILNDTYYEQFQDGLKGMKMMTAVHPVWGTSARNPEMKVDEVVAFIDSLMKMAEEIGVK